MVKTYSFTVGRYSKDKIYSSTISSKGQVTVPQEIRIRLGLNTGDRVEFVVEGEQTIMRPSRSSSSKFDKYKGALGTFSGGEKQINSWLRNLRAEEVGRK